MSLVIFNSIDQVSKFLLISFTNIKTANCINLKIFLCSHQATLNIQILRIKFYVSFPANSETLNQNSRINGYYFSANGLRCYSKS